MSNPGTNSLRLPWMIEDRDLFNSVGFPIETDDELAFIVRAVNSHDALVDACQSLLDEYDGGKLSRAINKARAALVLAEEPTL